MRVAYIWASGNVYSNRYAAGWGANDPLKDLNMNYNIGDLFVTESSLRLTDPTDVKVFQIENTRLDAHAQLVNDGFDIAFVRGANTVSDEPYAKTLADFLEKIRVPVITLGMGIQAPDLHSMPKSPDALRLVRILGERCKTVGLRGSITADYFEKNGTKNIRIVGCPSILRHNDRDLKISKKPWAAVHSMGFSLTRGHNNKYARDAGIMWDVQKDLLKQIDREKKLIIFTQVELEEKAYAYREPAAIVQARNSLYQSKWFDRDIEKIYEKSCVFFSPNPVTYDMMVRACDAIIGTRLHGNAMALACGIPPITLAIDLRVQEIYEFWKLPNLRIERAMGRSVRELYEGADFSEFNRNFPIVYDNMRAYFDENGVRNKMAGTVA